MPEIKLIDRIDRVSRKRGNGLLRREVWIDQVTRIVTRYNLAYINHDIYQGDNGRVLGYDNKHGFHHRHFMGQIQEVDFVTFEITEKSFEDEWLNLRGNKQ